MKKFYLSILSIFLLSNAFADNQESNAPRVIPVAKPIGYTNYPTTEQQSESQVEKEYSGIVGTGIKHTTVSAAGAAVEFAPSAANFYVFFTQTLDSGIYYEGRLYTRDNYTAQNPIYPSVPISNENNPWGYGAVVKLGYDFHPSETVDLIPYLRVNAYNNMSVVYEDSDGDSIHSTTLAVLPGMKIAYKVTPQFNPYVDLFGGWQQVNLSGNFPQSATPGSATGTISQTMFTYEIGFSSKLAPNLALIPYMQYITTTNSPNSTASEPYSKNGFNISSLTTTQQVFGLKLSASW
jgi:hypothetical protein